MRKLNAFIQMSLDGYFADAKGGVNWAHQASDDTEWNDFVSGNASGGGELMFGRITYDMMIGFWPTPAALETMPAVAEQMNSRPKYVISRTLREATWNNTTILSGDLATEIRKVKSANGDTITILGSGSVVTQLAREGLIDSIQIVINPTALGDGKKLFGELGKKLRFELTQSRTFANGNVVVWYEPIA